MSACPGCSAPTPTYTTYRTNGEVDVLDNVWCHPCIDANVAATRAGRECGCAQFPGVHFHAPDGSLLEAVPA